MKDVLLKKLKLQGNVKESMVKNHFRNDKLWIELWLLLSTLHIQKKYYGMFKETFIKLYYLKRPFLTPNKLS